MDKIWYYVAISLWFCYKVLAWWLQALEYYKLNYKMFRYAISELWKDKNGFFGRSQAANRPLVTPGSHEDFPDSDKTPIVDQLQNWK